MLSMIVVIPGPTGPKVGELNWELGKPMEVAPEMVHAIVADGSELSYILDNFVIPYRKDAKSHVWHGDLAKLIVGNIVQSSVLTA